jgi:phosphate transport system substrate-binding protein
MLLTVSCAGPQGHGEGTRVTVAGSTSVQPYMEILAENYVRRFQGSDVDVQGGGSSAGISSVGSGIADIGMSSRSLSESEDESYLSIEIAWDGLALIVHPSNPINSLTIEQIRDIYSGRITDWGDVGGNRGEEIFVISREAGSGTRSFFEELVMDSLRISNRAIIQSTNGTIRTLVSGDARGNRQAIGFISLGLLDLPGQNPVKGIAIDGALPTNENIENQSYKLFRPFLIVTDMEPTDEVMDFIDFITSDDGQSIMENRGLVRIMSKEQPDE